MNRKSTIMPGVKQGDKELAVKRVKTHLSWKRMIDRCSNPNNKRWEHYGGRGIKICDRWLDFPNFLIDMGERPQEVE